MSIFKIWQPLYKMIWIFPIFHIAYSLLYFSTIEKEEGVALFKKLEFFGTKNKNYESSNVINED